MIPEFTILEEVEQQEHAELTYKLDLKNKRIIGMIDGLEACVQAMLKIILTERYSTVIYSSEYGTELETLIGVNIPLVQTDLERRLREALSVDVRFVDIKQFTTSVTGFNEIEVQFLLETVYGSDLISQRILV
jgi:predicted membrane-bound spermidine synthase